MRLFVALVLPEPVQAHLRRQCASWRREPTLRLARFAVEFHVTLKFLGDVSAEQLDAVADALSYAYASVAPFEVSCGGLGAFPSGRRASVLWQGVEDGALALTTSACMTEDALEPLGFSRERRAFTPHVTLARFRTPANVAEWITAENTRLVPCPTFTAVEITLVESMLRPQGSLYTSRAVYPLQSV